MGIYIPIWLDLLLMEILKQKTIYITFTFQYGQIYYYYKHRKENKKTIIYIPIWLDLL